jgi:RNA polymerase sigma-70 factor (ECF subfamily)
LGGESARTSRIAGGRVIERTSAGRRTRIDVGAVTENAMRDLVRRAGAGDRSAADSLVREVAGPVRAAIRRRLGDGVRRRVDTDDVFQSTMVVALARLDGLEFRGEKELVGWFAQIAEHQVVDAARRERRERRDVAREERLGTHPAIPAGETSPTGRVVRDETALGVRAAVALLSDDERRIVELRSYEGRSFDEIARVLGLADRHVARRRFRAALDRMGHLIEDGRAT